MRAQIAEKYGGWPHEVGRFPLRYFRKLSRVILLEARAIRKANKDPNSISWEEWEAERIKGEPV